MGITPSGKTYLDLKGYSTWERRILRKLYDEGGDSAMHGVQYIIANNIHIKLGESVEINGNPYGLPPSVTGDWQSLAQVEGWYDREENAIFLNPNQGYSDDEMPSNFGLATIIHEAKHLEQGADLANSRLGEMQAGQTGLNVLLSLEGKTPNQLTQNWQRDMYSATTVDEYYSAFCSNNHPYCTNLTILPPLPGDGPPLLWFLHWP